MIGNIALAVTLAACVSAIVLYVLVARGRTELLTAARRSTQLAILGMFTACGTLLYYIFNYRFDIAYVYEHVSTKLSTLLLFSTFYASQEGSFMLWGLWTALIAIFLMDYSRRQRYETHVMPIFLTVLTFIAIMLIAKSPFESIFAANPGQLTADQIPLNGKGLNPSLENLWIVIHPPMLFLGFSLLAVPFAFALAGLIKRDYQGWVVTSMPWVLGAAMVLGFGIMLGGFWAYETLGWGGYWAWDPVENASLLPWLMTVAASHTMLTQKRTGGLVKTNIAMTLIAYALVLYGSFLTRSGALADASVHSFADPGNLAYSMLLGALVVFIVVPFGFFFWRWREMAGYAQDYKILSRETTLSIASAVIGASALVVFIGTSAPLLKKKVDIDFYNNLHIPIAIVLLLVNGLSLLLKWRQSSVQDLRNKSIFAGVVAVIATATVALLGVHDVRYIVMLFAAFFALTVNAEMGWKILRSHWQMQFDRSEPSRADYFRRVRIALFLTLGVGLVALVVGTAGDYNLYLAAIQNFGKYAVLLFAILLIVFVVVGYPRFTLDTKFLGAYVAHAGLALFMIGVVASARYSEKEVDRLPINKAVSAFGGKYMLTFRGAANGQQEHTYWLIDVDTKNGYLGTAKPLTFWTDFNNRSEPIRNPGILKYATRDLYFTINSSELEGGIPRDTLAKMQTISVLHDSLKITFLDFDFPQAEKAKMMSQQPFHVKANVVVHTVGAKDTAGIPLTLGVTRNLATQEAQEDDIVVPGTNYHVQLSELKPDMQHPANSKVVLRYFDDNNPPPAPVMVITVEAFMKPYINLVWFGIITLVIGFAFAVLRRRREALVAIDRAERAYDRFLSSEHSHRDPDASPATSKSLAGRLIKKKHQSGA